MGYPIEEWKPVVGYEEAYEVSNRGRVRRSGRSTGATLGRLMKQNLFKHGIHLYVGLCPYRQGHQGLRKNQKKIPVHMIVAEAFLGPRPPGMHINHIDGNGLNNWAENLEYCTPTRNVHHALLTGLTKHNLTPEMVRAIRALPAELTHREIARRYGIHESQISRLRRGLVWTFVD
jgi:hypothetical protein